MAGFARRHCFDWRGGVGGEQNGWMDATGWFLVPVHHDTILVEEVVYFWDCGM